MSFGDGISLGDLTQTLASVAFLKDSSPVDVERRAADMPAFQPGAAHSGPYPLSKHSDQMISHFSGGAGRKRMSKHLLM